MAIDKLYVSNLALSMIGGKRLTVFPSTTGSTNEINAIYDNYDTVRDLFLESHPWSYAQKRLALVDITRTTQDDWITATAYEVDDIVYDLTLTKYYKCLSAHTSGTLFATDLAAGKWVLYTSWVTGTVYAKGDKKYNAGVEYACLVNHTAGTFATDLTSVYWKTTELIVDMKDSMSVAYYRPTDLIHLNYKSLKSAIVKVEATAIYSDSADLAIQYTYQNDDPSKYTPKSLWALATLLASTICAKVSASETIALKLFERYTKIDLPSAKSEDSKQSTPLGSDMYDWERVMMTSGGGFITGETWQPI